MCIRDSPERWLRELARELFPLAPPEVQGWREPGTRGLALRSLEEAQLQLVRCLRREKEGLARRLRGEGEPGSLAEAKGSGLSTSAAFLDPDGSDSGGGGGGGGRGRGCPCRSAG